MKKAQVLLIEDDAILQKLYRQIIEFYAPGEYEVTVYQGEFAKAVENVDWENVDILLCDQLLGLFTRGNSILKWVEKNYPEIHRVMLTGDGLIDPKVIHANIFLMKPVYPEELINSLRMPDGRPEKDSR